MTFDARFSGEQFIKIKKGGIKLERVSHLLEKTWAFPWQALRESCEDCPVWGEILLNENEEKAICKGALVLL